VFGSIHYCETLKELRYTDEIYQNDGRKFGDASSRPAHSPWRTDLVRAKPGLKFFCFDNELRREQSQRQDYDSQLFPYDLYHFNSRSLADHIVEIPTANSLGTFGVYVL
jgi:hypothetical protein